MAELTFRPATLDDATFVSDVDTAARPHRPADPVVLRYWWEHPSDTWSEERYVVERGGSPVGYALMDHPHWGLAADRRANVSAELLPDERTAERFDACLAAMEERAIDAGAQLLRVRADERTSSASRPSSGAASAKIDGADAGSSTSRGVARPSSP